MKPSVQFAKEQIALQKEGNEQMRKLVLSADTQNEHMKLMAETFRDLVTAIKRH